MQTLILASGSPRRSEILQRLGIPHRAVPQDIDETFTGDDPVEESTRLARAKLESLLSGWAGPHPLALAADTFIFFNNAFLGKPENRDEALRMLSALSGKSHDVITGLALHSPEFGITSAAAVTRVFFGRLTPEEIDWYLDTGEWRGAAGAYRLQEKGAGLVDRIEGSCSNVMGLPIRTFYGMLRQHKCLSALPGGPAL